MLYEASGRDGPFRAAQRLTDRAVKSAERTLAVFEIFSQEQRGLRVGEVSRNLDIPQPSVSMLLKNLARLGYLKHDPQRRTFSPTIRLVLLGSWLNRRFTPTGGFEEKLADLQAGVGGTVYVAMQNAASVQYILVRDHAHGDRPSIRSGEMRPLTTCATGHILLSAKSDAEVRGWIRRSNAEVSEDGQRVNENDFLQFMQRVRRSGYADTTGAASENPGEIAISILSPFENSLLAIAVSVPTDCPDARKQAIITALQRFKADLGQERAALVAAA
jgi:IclR family transcriptional regulator, KDG regulon repressor